VPGQERGAAGVTREGPDILGDIVNLLHVPERERTGKDGRGERVCVKPTEGAFERLVTSWKVMGIKICS
jgi:hypothetical protein